jgi:pimeloyl-ACP methyl ester carboxylesterase
VPYVTRNNVKVFFESFGQGAPALVFLHPWTTNHYIWALQVNAFARKHRCIVMDHRGHGQSDKPASGYAVGEMAADVVAMLDQLGIERAILVGNSIGGMIAMQTCLDAPKRVIGNLILSSGTNLGADAPPELGEELKKDWRAVMSGLMASGVSAKSKIERPEIVAFMEGCFRNSTNFTDEVFWASVGDSNGVFGWNISDRLKDVRQPTLIIAGEEDGATTVAQNQFLADRIPGSKIKIYKDVGHFCQLEKPMLFNSELEAFIKQVGQ